MDADEMRRIGRERVGGWIEKLVAEHATPFVLLGIGHDDRSGEWIVCIPKEPQLTPAILAAALRNAASLIERGGIR